jgi:hypothetical protein
MEQLVRIPTQFWIGSIAYVGWVQHRRIFMSDLGEAVTLVEKQPVHIPNMAQVLFVSRRLTYRLAPFLNGF